MKIAFAIRPNYLDVLGGDTFQLLKTKEYLEKDWNCEVTVVTQPEELSGKKYDILHAFNLQTTAFTYNMVKEAKKQNIVVVLSPIMWRFGDSRYVNRMTRITCNFRVIAAFKEISRISERLSIKEGFLERRSILESCDAILPNSTEEGEILQKHYDINVPTFIVPNCVDITMKEANSKNDLPQDIVLEVGRIEPTKNQLAVLLALMDHKDIPLYFVGKQNPVKKHYIDYLKKLSRKRGNTFFVTDVPQDELISYYKAAKVHVLPSFRESPGLVTLEALYHKANVVVADSKYCPITYYKLDEYGVVCNPFSIESVEKAILDAYYQDVKTIPAEYFDFIHYKNAAKMTRDAYLRILNQSK